MNTDDLKLLGLISLLRCEIARNKDELTCEQDGSKYEVMSVEAMTRILDEVEAGMIQKRSDDVAKKEA